jgi:hypothetical protein
MLNFLFVNANEEKEELTYSKNVYASQTNEKHAKGQQIMDLIAESETAEKKYKKK